MIKEARQPEPDPEETPGGLGGENARTERSENGLTHIKEARLIERATSEGWLGNRFPTREGKKIIQGREQDRGDINAIDAATLTAFDLMDDTDARNKRSGAAIVVAMEAQNQRDQLSDGAAASAASVLPGAHIGTAQIVLNIPDNGRGPRMEVIDEDDDGDDTADP